MADRKSIMGTGSPRNDATPVICGCEPGILVSRVTFITSLTLKRLSQNLTTIEAKL